MTKEQLQFKIDTKQPFEFTFNNKVYNMTYDKDAKGNNLIIFGRLYEGKKYTSLGELLNKAKIENCFFKDVLEDL